MSSKFFSNKTSNKTSTKQNAPKNNQHSGAKTSQVKKAGRGKQHNIRLPGIGFVYLRYNNKNRGYDQGISQFSQGKSNRSIS